MSSPEDFSADLRAFIHGRISSVEQISILILLQASPDRAWTIAGISQDLRSTDASVRKRLDDLCAAGVLVQSASAPNLFRYHPASSEVGALIVELIAAYRSRPNRVIDAIYSKPAETVRAFSDAFKLKKDK